MTELITLCVKTYEKLVSHQKQVCVQKVNDMKQDNEHNLSKEYTICKIHIEGFQNNTDGSQCMALLPLFIAKHVLWVVVYGHILQLNW